jgi:hypothetical protein
MPSILVDGAEYLSSQLQEHCGQTCTYFHNGDSLSVDLVPVNNAQPIDGQYAARIKDFSVPASSLVIDDDPFLPTELDEIEWTDRNDQPQIAVVFPRPSESRLTAQNCYRFTDPAETRLRIYAVDQESMVSVAILSGGNTYNFLGVPSTIRGAEQYDGLDTTKLLTTSVYLLRSQFEGNGITTPPIMASVDVHDLVGWSVDMGQTEWGETLVKLGLQRETLTREWQARRNAAV